MKNNPNWEDDTLKLINKVIALGVPLPTFNYEFQQFESVVMKNEEFGDGGVRGIEIPELHDSYVDALIRILHYYDPE